MLGRSIFEPLRPSLTMEIDSMLRPCAASTPSAGNDSLGAEFTPDKRLL